MITLFDNETILKAYIREKTDAAKREGRNEGRKEGKIEGRKEGKRNKAIDTAKNLLKEGLPVDLIARAVNLSASEINIIKEFIAN